LIYERALRNIPRSYKLWMKYLSERIHDCNGLRPDHPAYEDCNNTFDRSMVSVSSRPAADR
jgi:hypothetical protein